MSNEPIECCECNEDTQPLFLIKYKKNKGFVCKTCIPKIKARWINWGKFLKKVKFNEKCREFYIKFKV